MFPLRSRLLVVLAVVGVLVAASSVPASANTVVVFAVDGDLVVHDQFDRPLFAFDPVGSECSTTWKTVSVAGTSGSGWASVAVDVVRPVLIDSYVYRARVDLGLSGPYASGGTAALSGSGSMVLVRSSSMAPCSALVPLVSCTITFDDLVVSGTLTSYLSLPTLTTGDSLVLHGGNDLFEDTVTGTASDCGPAIQADLGRLIIDGLELEVA